MQPINHESTTMNQALNRAQPPLGTIPPEIRCAADYEAMAAHFMARPAYDYVAGGSGHDVTVAANRAAFARHAIYPRLLRSVAAGHTRLSIGAQHFAHPVFLAPVAFQTLAHDAGELDSARAAHAMDSCFILSTLSAHTLEDVARVAGAQRWFQLYFQPRRDDTLALVRRAEAAGYQAIVITLDATIQMPSQRALRSGFRLPPECVAVNLQSQSAPGQVTLEPGQSAIFGALMAAAPDWEDLAWLMANTTLPVWVKGVLHPQDAVDLFAAGVAGVVVSNHGGRGLDGAPASLDALAAIRSAVGASAPLLFDGGIRSGADVFKAIALGANAVLVGRLQMYALSVAGALGVAHMVRLLREEFEVCMALAGCASVADIGPGALHTQPPGTSPC
jgi:isopentenyl diphosphate isomerase/L-lactate dehydrogenase-like FMN-dependent dehydrogenase